MKNLTDRFRKLAWALWVLCVLAAIAGWFLDKDPSKLAPVIAWVTAAAAAGEGANIGKRATYRPDHHEVNGNA